MISLAQRITELRTEKGMSRPELSAALGLPKKELDGVLRISFSWDTGEEDILALAEGLEAAHRELFTALS